MAGLPIQPQLLLGGPTTTTSPCPSRWKCFNWTTTHHAIRSKSDRAHSASTTAPSAATAATLRIARCTLRQCRPPHRERQRELWSTCRRSDRMDTRLPLPKMGDVQWLTSAVAGWLLYQPPRNPCGSRFIQDLPAGRERRGPILHSYHQRRFRARCDKLGEPERHAHEDDRAGRGGQSAVSQ